MALHPVSVLKNSCTKIVCIVVCCSVYVARQFGGAVRMNCSSSAWGKTTNAPSTTPPNSVATICHSPYRLAAGLERPLVSRGTCQGPLLKGGMHLCLPYLMPLLQQQLATLTRELSSSTAFACLHGTEQCSLGCTLTHPVNDPFLTHLLLFPACFANGSSSCAVCMK